MPMWLRRLELSFAPWKAAERRFMGVMADEIAKLPMTVYRQAVAKGDCRGVVD